ncbi:MAG: glycosyltransferase family 2 protein [Pseudomonadota bacterium]
MTAEEFRAPPTLDLVVPCYNEEDCLEPLIAALRELSDGLVTDGRIAGMGRVILVDDGSSDRTWEMIQTAVQEAGVGDGLAVLGVKLSKNHGHQRALLAGLMTADADVVISLDADLQDDIGAIAKMITAYRAGAEIVFGVRASRETDTTFKRFTARTYYRGLRFIGADVVQDHADFRLMTQKALAALRAHPEANLYLRGLIKSLGFSSAVVTYDRNERVAGETKYPLRKMVGLAIEGVTSSSIKPLRYVTLLGFLIALFSIGYIIWAVVARFLGITVSGWASIVGSIYLLGGVQLLCLGVFGEYLGRIYLETKRRPQFLIDQVARSDEPHSS